MSAISQTLGPSALWYFARSTGAVSLVLLTASVVLGIVSTSGYHTERLPRFALQGLHRNLSLLALVVVVVHIATAIFDGFAPIVVTDSFLPFASKYRGLWLGFGALSVDLLIAVLVTTMVRKRLGYRSWRAVHLLSYGAWPLALIHSLGSGTDTRAWWMLAIYGACAATVVAAGGWRLTSGWPQASPRSLRPAIIGTSAAASIGLGIWLVQGPLAPGWASRAGTPASLLQPASASAAPTAPAQTDAFPSPPFTSPLSGTIKNQTDSDAGDTVITLNAVLSQANDAQLTVVLHGQPLPSGGVSLTSGRVELGTKQAPAAYQGSVQDLSSGQLVADLSNSEGRSLRLVADLKTTSDTVTGTARVRSLLSGQGR